MAAAQITMHKDALHFGGVEHRSMHNLNGALFHNATAQVCGPHCWHHLLPLC